MLSSLLWLLLATKGLRHPKGRGFKVVTYADDVIILVSDTTLAELMLFSLVIVSSWATNCGLGINPNKTSFILFSRK